MRFPDPAPWPVPNGGDVPPMPSGTRSEKPKPLILHCAGCAWSGELAEAVTHQAETDHGITYRGRLQDLKRHVDARRAVMGTRG